MWTLYDLTQNLDRKQGRPESAANRTRHDKQPVGPRSTVEQIFFLLEKPGQTDHTGGTAVG